MKKPSPEQINDQTNDHINTQIDDILLQLWQKNLPTIRERLDLLDQFGLAASTGTLAETNGMFSQSAIILPGTMQGCGQQAPQGAGWVISSTSFICAPGGGSFAGVHLFQQ